MNVRANDIQVADATYVLQTYKRAPVAFERGEGAWLYDVDGQAYLDLISGIGVASLGHAHPGLARALGEQASTLVHTSNLYHHPLQGVLARRLTEISGLARAFFCNSGTEAIEACLKFARRYWFTRGDKARSGFVAFEHAFHGRTFGSLSATWDEHYREPFEPLVPGVTFVPPDDPAAFADALEAFADYDTLYDLPPGYARALRYNLAVELAPEFGRPLDPLVAGLAAESLATIKRANVRTVPVGVDAALIVDAAGFDINVGE